jgi:hypothetical protein
VSTPVDCSELDTQCAPGLCNAATGLCSAQPTVGLEGTTCDDGDACTVGDACRNGMCSAQPKNCSALDDQCNKGSCHAGSGACVAMPVEEETECSDACFVGAGACRSGRCTGTPLDCSELTDQCNMGICVAGVCERDPTPHNGTACNDGVEATDHDTCRNGVCAGVDLCDGMTCPESTACRTVMPCFRGVCPPAEDRANGTSCDDGRIETVNDQCTNGECVGVDLCLGVVCAPTQCEVRGEKEKKERRRRKERMKEKRNE